MTATAQKPISILLVEDHEITRAGLHNLLNGFERFNVVGEAGTVSEAVEAAQRTKPDVVLLDIRLPDGDGFEACRRIQRSGNEARVLFLTSFADDEILFEAIACGADGYLLKEIDSRALIAAIENVAAGKSILDPAVTRRVLSRVRETGLRDMRDDDKIGRLSPQELRIVSLVADGKTNKEIAVALELSEKTVKNYLSNAMEKLNTHRRTQAATLYLQHKRRF